MNINYIKISEEFEDELTCCISYQIFSTPVVTEDGYTFQQRALKKWLQNSMKSPLTGLNLKNN